jgi:hypothetical protein
MAAVSQGTQAFQQAGLTVFEAARRTGESLEEAARRFIHSADPHEITGRRGERFKWSFSYADIPGIVAEAKEGPRHGSPAGRRHRSGNWRKLS